LFLLVFTYQVASSIGLGKKNIITVIITIEFSRYWISLVFPLLAPDFENESGFLNHHLLRTYCSNTPIASSRVWLLTLILDLEFLN
jgi:hypothetical protein